MSAFVHTSGTASFGQSTPLAATRCPNECSFATRMRTQWGAEWCYHLNARRLNDANYVETGLQAFVYAYDEAEKRPYWVLINVRDYDENGFRHISMETPFVKGAANIDVGFLRAEESDMAVLDMLTPILVESALTVPCLKCGMVPANRWLDQPRLLAIRAVRMMAHQQLCKQCVVNQSLIPNI